MMIEESPLEAERVDVKRIMREIWEAWEHPMWPMLLEDYPVDDHEKQGGNSK